MTATAYVNVACLLKCAALYAFLKLYIVLAECCYIVSNFAFLLSNEIIYRKLQRLKNVYNYIGFQTQIIDKEDKN